VKFAIILRNKKLKMIKKIFKKITTSLILLAAFSPYNLKAQIFTGGDEPEQTGLKILGEEEGAPLGETGVTAEADVGDLLLKYVNFVLPYLALAAFLGFVYAGFLYVTAYGNDEQIQKAKKILMYAVIGLIVVILSFSIVQLLTKELVEGI
jgi:hypothetical protein